MQEMVLPTKAGKDDAESSLPVCIIGGGGLGLALAATLCRGGSRVTLVCRPGSEPALRQRGNVKVSGATVARVELTDVAVALESVRLSPDPAEAWASEAVLLTVKGPDLFGLAAHLAQRASSSGEATYFVGFQNGVVKDEVLVRALGPRRVVGGATVLGCQRLEAGSVVVSGLGATFLGEFSGKGSARVARLAAAFSSAGLPVRVEQDIRSLLWTKFCHAIGVFGVSALTGLPSYDIFSRPSLAHAYLSLLAEAAAVAAKEKVVINDFLDLPISTNLRLSADEAVAGMVERAGPRPSGRPGFSSMAQDLASQRPTEVEETFGDLARRASLHGLAVPRTDLVYRVVRGRQEGYSTSDSRGASD